MSTMVKDEDGFILVEVLIGLALLSLVATATGYLLSMGSRRAFEVRKSKAEIEQVVVARLTLQGLADAITYVPDEGPALRGGPKRLEITSHGLPAFGLAIPARFVLATDESTGVLLSWMDTGTGLEHHERLTAAYGATFAYFGSDRDQPAGWRDEWSAPRPPKLLMVNLDRMGASSRQLVLEIRTDLFDTCLVEPDTGCVP